MVSSCCQPEYNPNEIRFKDAVHFVSQRNEKASYWGSRQFKPPTNLNLLRTALIKTQNLGLTLMLAPLMSRENSLDLGLID